MVILIDQKDQASLTIWRGIGGPLVKTIYFQYFSAKAEKLVDLSDDFKSFLVYNLLKGSFGFQRLLVVKREVFFANFSTGRELGWELF